MRVYHLEDDDHGSSWKQLGKDIDGKAADDWSGTYVSLFENGRTYLNDGNRDKAGHVGVHLLEGGGSGSSWKQLGHDIDGEVAYGKSGYVSLSADGEIIAIGSPYNDDNGDDSGHVRVFDRTLK